MTTRRQLVEAAINDPAARAASDANPLVVRRRALYAAAATGVLADLAAAGFPEMTEVGQLQAHRTYQPDVAAFAVEALGKLRFAAATDRLERLRDSPDPNVRTQVRKALKRLAVTPTGR